MHVKTDRVAVASSSAGLYIKKRKDKIPKYNTESNRITIGGETLGEVGSYTYQVRTIDGQGGCDADVNAKIGTVRAAFLHLKNT